MEDYVVEIGCLLPFSVGDPETVLCYRADNVALGMAADKIHGTLDRIFAHWIFTLPIQYLSTKYVWILHPRRRRHKSPMPELYLGSRPAALIQPRCSGCQIVQSPQLSMGRPHAAAGQLLKEFWCTYFVRSTRDEVKSS